MAASEDATRGALILVTGGSRSGKSAFAERLAAAGGDVLYVATADAGDAEMAARIAAHRARRPAHWPTVEAPLEPAHAIRERWRGERMVLLESLDLLVSNVLLAEWEQGDAVGRLARACDALIALPRETGCRLIVVTSEVGSGLVPLSALARRYCDLLGELNQRLAAVAEPVYLVVSGIAVDLRKIGVRLDDRT